MAARCGLGSSRQDATAARARSHVEARPIPRAHGIMAVATSQRLSNRESAMFARHTETASDKKPPTSGVRWLQSDRRHDLQQPEAHPPLGPRADGTCPRGAPSGRRWTSGSTADDSRVDIDEQVARILPHVEAATAHRCTLGGGGSIYRVVSDHRPAELSRVQR
jgi:hypothetical protein